MINHLDLSLLNLELAVFHRVYSHPKSATTQPKLSQKIISFEDKNIDKSLYLKQEITKVVNDYAVSITFNKETQSIIPLLVKDLLERLNDIKTSTTDKTALFLDRSKTIAQELNKVHDARVSSGILAILYGHVERKQILIIAKLEEEKALQINELDDGNITHIDIQFVEHLIKFHKGNVMKVGVFYRESN